MLCRTEFVQQTKGDKVRSLCAITNTVHPVGGPLQTHGDDYDDGPRLISIRPLSEETAGFVQDFVAEPQQSAQGACRTWLPVLGGLGRQGDPKYWFLLQCAGSVYHHFSRAEPTAAYLVRSGQNGPRPHHTRDGMRWEWMNVCVFAFFLFCRPFHSCWNVIVRTHFFAGSIGGKGHGEAFHPSGRTWHRASDDSGTNFGCMCIGSHSHAKQKCLPKHCTNCTGAIVNPLAVFLQDLEYCSQGIKRVQDELCLLQRTLCCRWTGSIWSGHKDTTIEMFHMITE